MRTSLIACSLLVLVPALGFAKPPGTESKPNILTPESLPEGLGREIINDSCTKCHAMSDLTTRPYSAREWIEITDRMIELGVDLEDSEYYALLGYLIDNLAIEETSSQW